MRLPKNGKCDRFCRFFFVCTARLVFFLFYRSQRLTVIFSRNYAQADVMLWCQRKGRPAAMTPNTRVPHRHVCRQPFSGDLPCTPMCVRRAGNVTPYSSLLDAFRFAERTILVVVHCTTTAWRNTRTANARESVVCTQFTRRRPSRRTGSPVLFVCYRFLFPLLLINWNRRRQPWPGCAVRKTLNTRVHIPIERTRARARLTHTVESREMSSRRPSGLTTLESAEYPISRHTFIYRGQGSGPSGAWCFRIATELPCD